MKLFPRLCIVVGCLILFASTALAAVPLNEANLKESIAARVNTILKERNQAEPGVPSRIAPDAVRIETAQYVEIKGIGLYAVKLSLHAGTENGEDAPAPDEMVLLTDPSGSVQFGLVTDIRTGEEAAMSQAQEISRLSIPPHLAKPLLTGTGQKDVVFVSDPFCPYCREAYKLLLGQVSLIKNLSIVHLPLPMHPGADAAAWIMEYAREHAETLYRDVVDFAYSGLRAVTGQDSATPDAAQKDVISQFLTRFPKLTDQQAEPFFFFLKGKYETSTAAVGRELRKLRINGTPVVIIDGQATHGFDPEETLRRLAK